MGRPPIGDAPLTAAERQRRHRALMRAAEPEVIRSPAFPMAERQALAEAIERHRGAIEERDRTTAALDRAGLRRLDAASAVHRAESALAEARAGQGPWLASALLDDRDVGTSPVKAAEASLTIAKEQYAALAGGEEPLRERLVEIEREIEWAQQRLQEQAAAVLATAPAVVQLVEQVEELQRQLAVAGDRLLWLVRNNVLTPQPGYGYDPAVDDLPRSCQAAGGWCSRLAARRQRLMKPDTWRVFETCLKALETDAEAALPE